MKKMISLMLCVMLCLTGTVLCARPAEAQNESLPPWCVLECEDTIFTVISPQEEEMNCSFYVSITNAAVLELLIRDFSDSVYKESEELLWPESFAAPTENEEGPVTVQMTRSWGELIAQTYIAELYVHLDGTIRVERTIKTDYPTDWNLYYVQAGAYTQAEQAHDRLQELTQSGFDGVIKLCDGWYRVQVGAFAYYGNAQKQMDQLKESGFEDVMIITDLIGEIVEGEGPFASPFPIYIVQEGDTLWSIAEKFFGNGAQWQLISEENIIGEEIYIGQPLRIPH